MVAVVRPGARVYGAQHDQMLSTLPFLEITDIVGMHLRAVNMKATVLPNRNSCYNFTYNSIKHASREKKVARTMSMGKWG
jgi:hypothetical protein